MLAALKFTQLESSSFQAESAQDTIKESEKEELESIEAQLNELNAQNNFSDSNLVSQCIDSLEQRELKTFGYIAKCFITLCGIFFTIKLTSEYFLISAPTFANRFDFRSLSYKWSAQLCQLICFLCSRFIIQPSSLSLLLNLSRRIGVGLF
jgi:hypothetical protein